MEIRVLRYFLAVVREEGINRAAEALHITQPTLSRQMAQLEEEIGVKLFHRGAKKITLTNEGLLLRRRAEEILELVDRTEKELGEQDELVEGRIVIGGGELAAMQLLPEMIERFREKYPRVTFDIFTGNADLVKEQMEKGLIDIGVLLEPVDMEKFEFIRLKGKERWVVLMSPDHPLAEKEAVSAEDLEGLPLILTVLGQGKDCLQTAVPGAYGKQRICMEKATAVQSGAGQIHRADPMLFEHNMSVQTKYLISLWGPDYNVGVEKKCNCFSSTSIFDMDIYGKEFAVTGG